MRRVIVMAVLTAWVSVACGGGDKADEAAGAGATSTVPSSSTSSSSSPTMVDTSRPGGGYGTVATTTTVPTASEVALDATFVVERHGVAPAFTRTSINGTVYPNGLVIDTFSYEREWRIEIDAGRDYTRFRGDLGIPDNQPSATFYRVEIILDNGSPALSAEVRFGETKTIDLDVTNVLRIRIVLTPNGEGDIAIGNPRLSR